MNKSTEVWQTPEILGGLDEPVKLGDLARSASYSEPQFYRIAKRALGQTPMSARRRLLLERSAYRLGANNQLITDIAFDAGFDSLEGFSRSFRRAYGLSPSAYRKLKPAEFRIDLSESLHYAPVQTVPRQGVSTMNVTELITEHHVWLMNTYLDCCEGLEPGLLDRPLAVTKPFLWSDDSTTLRDTLGSASAFAAPWMHAINGIETPYRPKDLAAMRELLPVNQKGFLDIVAAVEKDRSYDLTFVDAVCEPPEVFTYGGVIAHMLTFASYRRMAIGMELRNLGLTTQDEDPLGYANRLFKKGRPTD